MDKKISQLDSVSSINNDAVFPFSQVIDNEEVTVKAPIGQISEAVAERIYKDITGTFTAGLTSITLQDSSITTNSTIEVYTDNDVDYNSITIAAGSVTIEFDAQESDLGVKVRVS